MKTSMILSLIVFLCCVQAATIYQSSTLGVTGLSGGTTVSSGQFLGGRFQVTSAMTTTTIGGHFQGSGNFFAAIVRLTSLSDMPDSANLNTPDVVATTLLNFPSTSTVVSGSISADLSVGYYAIIFGSGLFGATGSGATITNGTDIGSPNYFFKSATTYNNGGFTQAYFFLQGNATVIPEPSTLLFVVIVCAGMFLRKKMSVH